MKIKSIVTAVTSVALVAGFCVTSALATNHNNYNETYTYTETGNEMKTVAQGTLTGASTQASNSTGKYSRYIEVSVMEKNQENNTTIKSNDSTITTTNTGIGCGIPRDADNPDVYYCHQSLMKPSATVSFTIDSTVINVYQYN